ncbi:hypothetical protein AB0N65_17280 [Paenarthrobacter sp. NPDC089322]|uniref:hypothetical protein n=1 Tax=Paenarthrobacter sp. NPDC089322 TaxID=3155065 RepID=UPI00343016B1
MNQLSPGPHDSQPTGTDTTAGTAPSAKSDTAGTSTAGAAGAPAKYDAVAGPFTIRDLTVFGSALLMFIASLLPMFGGRYNLWNLGNLFFLLLGIILPLVVVALFVARRLQPGTVVRVGSLSIDQFASVTAAFAFPLFFLTIADSFSGSVLLGLVGSVGLLAATVLGPHLPWISADFKGRTETPAHVVARQAAVPSRKPAAPKAPAAPKSPAASAGSPGGPGASGVGPSGPGASGVGPSAIGPSGAGPSGAGGPYSPPAVFGARPSAGTDAPAVVHSADSKEAAPHAAGAQGAGVPAAGTPASKAQAAGAQAAAAASASGAAASGAQATGASAAGRQDSMDSSRKSGTGISEPATIQHAQEPASQQPSAQQPSAQQTASQQSASAPPASNERAWAATMATPVVSADTRAVTDSIGATVDPASRPDESNSAPTYEAFWFAVAQPRTAYDERTGAPAFTIEPGGWVLALEDRGHEFLVQDTDGKVGVLRELSNIERG